MRKIKRNDAQTIADILSAFAAGEGSAEIGARYGVSGQVIRQIASENGVKSGREKCWSDHRDANLMAMIEAGQSISAIAVQFGCSEASVKTRMSVLRGKGYKIPYCDRRFWTPDQVSNLKEMWLAGVPATEIAARIGCTPKAVYVAVQRFGVNK